MKKRLISVLAFALAVSAGAAFVLYQLISTRVKASNTPKAQTAKVYVAAHDMEVGALVQEKDLKPVEYLTVPSGAVMKKEDIVGRGVSSPVHQDSPFFEPALAPKGGGAGFSATIPIGMRACAVHVNEVMGVAGFAVAGMHVDVLVSGQPGGGGSIVEIPGSASAAGGVTRTLLQDVLVMSAGQNYQKDSEGKPFYFQVVNLLVTPEQAELLYLATDQKIQLVLRNPADHTVVNTGGATTSELFSGTRAPKPSPAPVTMARLAPPPPRPAPSVAVSPAPPLEIPAPKPAAPAAEKAPEPPAKFAIEVYAGDKRTEALVSDPGKGGKK
jgi:pilus assembly protein CpaB